MITSTDLHMYMQNLYMFANVSNVSGLNSREMLSKDAQSMANIAGSGWTFLD